MNLGKDIAICKVRILSKRCGRGRIKLSWQFFYRTEDTLLASMFLNLIERMGFTSLAIKSPPN